MMYCHFIQDALKRPPIPQPTPPGTKTSLISSRISHLALGVNIAALSATPRTFSKNSDGNSPTPANRFDAVHLLASQVQAQTGPNLNHVSILYSLHE